MEVIDPSKELRLMLAFFGEAELPLCERIEAADVPEPFRALLVHHDHMTVTLERHFGGSVQVRPYLVQDKGDLYGRKLDLVTEKDGTIVMTGIMIFNFGFSTPQVRQEILDQRKPLGRILIEHDILRQVTSETYLRIDAKDPLVARFGLSEPTCAYGRLATIFCDGKPAVDLLEIVSPQS